MLRTIVNSTLFSHTMIIGDSVDYNGRSLLLYLIKQLSLDEQNKIHVLCYENHIEYPTGYSNPALQFHNCTLNPRGWINDGSEENSQKESSIFETAKAAVGDESGEFVLIIDSLSYPLFNYGVPQCYRDLHSLVSKPINSGSKLKQLVCLVHEDFIPNRDSTIQKLHHFATTYLQIEPSENGNPGSGIVRIMYKKPGGKVIKKVEQFFFDGDGHVVSSEVQQAPMVLTPLVDQESSMDKLTTFKLDLREEEKRARSKLVLPYLRSENKSNEGGGGGQVFYQPDAADDWDEEDPDDDLDV